MSKIYGLFGSMTGKVADVVMVVRNGEQIVRKYQPIVSNPSTPAQVAARARLKLMSQTAAVMAPVIAIPRQGAVSPRNMFMKVNYDASSYSNDAATLQLENVKLTKSVVGLPALNVTRTAGGDLNLAIAPTTQKVFDRVAYAVFHRTATNELIFDGSVVSSEAGVNNTFEATFGVPSSANVQIVYAYGVRDNTDAARARFENMSILTAEMVANLIVSRTLMETDVTLTETKSQIIAPANANMRSNAKK